MQQVQKVSPGSVHCPTTPVDLCDKGHEQAKELSCGHEGVVVDSIISNDLKVLLEYAEAHPESLRVPPMNFPLNLEGNGEKAGEPTKWENGGAIYAHAHLVSPAGPELYARIGPWYPAALEGIWDFIGKAARWHQAKKA